MPQYTCNGHRSCGAIAEESDASRIKNIQSFLRGCTPQRRPLAAGDLPLQSCTYAALNMSLSMQGLLSGQKARTVRIALWLRYMAGAGACSSAKLAFAGHDIARHVAAEALRRTDRSPADEFIVTTRKPNRWNDERLRSGTRCWRSFARSCPDFLQRALERFHI